MLKTQNLRKVKYTKKKKNKKKIDNLWIKFDNEKLNETKKLELLYTQSNLRQRDICDLCQSTVAYLENKLLNCIRYPVVKIHKINIV